MDVCVCLSMLYLRHTCMVIFCVYLKLPKLISVNLSQFAMKKSQCFNGKPWNQLDNL